MKNFMIKCGLMSPLPKLPEPKNSFQAICGLSIIAGWYCKGNKEEFDFVKKCSNILFDELKEGGKKK